MPFAAQGGLGTLTVWKNYRWAPEWYRDAKAEAAEPGRQARRREIIFAVALAESFLFEFVLVQVLANTNDRFRVINEYFPPGAARDVQAKWKDIPKALFKAGLIPATPDLGGEEWEDFQRLVQFRNGLIHGGSSRPDTADLQQKFRPLPSPTDLDEFPPGYALTTVLVQIRALCRAAELPPPDWVPST